VADPVGRQPRGSKQLSYGWDDLAVVIALTAAPARVIDLVGPHGFIHGWIFVGIPGAGQKVTFAAGRHAIGTVEGADATHVHVRMADGSVQHVEHHGSGTGQLARIPTAVPQYTSTRAQRDQANKALVAARGATPGKASSVAGKRTQTELLARAVGEHPQMVGDEVLGEHIAGMRASLNAGDTRSFDAHRDAAEARIRQHGAMPAGDIKDRLGGDMGAPPAPKGKSSSRSEKQLELVCERMSGGDRSSGEMKPGDMQESCRTRRTRRLTGTSSGARSRTRGGWPSPAAGTRSPGGGSPRRRTPTATRTASPPRPTSQRRTSAC